MRSLKAAFVFLGVSLALVLSGPVTEGQSKPKRINRIVELLENDQPVYYVGSHSGTEGTIEAGKRDAMTTHADYITYDMEHAPLDFRGLAEYMKGTAAAGPTRSGHRVPVVVVLPVQGTDEMTVRANNWMFTQALATGVHGILLAHADTPGAVRAFVEASRFPVHKQGLDKDLPEGRRGAHGTPMASAIWRVSPAEYVQKADAWPLNPDGELVLGLKLEDRWAVQNADEILKVPGIAFAEWGPGDNALSHGLQGMAGAAQNHPTMRAARNKVFAATKANKVFFLEGFNVKNVEAQIREGVRVGPASPEAAEMGRKFSKRQLPW